MQRAISETRKVITRLMENKGIPGISISVGVNGKPVWSEGFGLADIENRVPMTEDSLVRIGSISKVVTTLAVSKLMENEKLNIDEPIQKYLPRFPEKYWNGEKVTITTRHLMNHTSGLRHYRTIKEWNKVSDPTLIPKAIVDAIDYRSRLPRRALPPEFYIRQSYSSSLEAIGLFQDDPLLFKTGRGLVYSSMGWILISAIIESLVQKNFVEHMRDVLDGLALKNTVIESCATILQNRVRFYCFDDSGNLTNAPDIDVSWKAGSGGFMSTVKDLLKLAHVYLNSYWSNSDITGQFSGYFKSDTVKELWTRNPEFSDDSGTFGLGFISNVSDICCNPNTVPCHYILHTGRGVGFGAVLHITLEGEENLSGDKVTVLPSRNGETGNGIHTHCNNDVAIENRQAISVAMLANLENINMQYVGLNIASFFLNKSSQGMAASIKQSSRIF